MSNDRIKWRDVAATAIQEHKAYQVEGELTMLLCLLASDVRPRVILEIGCAAGGSAWAWSHLPSVQKIIGVDMDPPQLEKCMSRDGIQTVMIKGNSLDPSTIVLAAEATLDGRPDMVFIDACHDYGSAMSDLLSYGPLCSPGGIIVMHDTQGFPGRDDFAAGRVFRSNFTELTKVELIWQTGGPGGTGIMWIPE